MTEREWYGSGQAQARAGMRHEFTAKTPAGIVRETERLVWRGLNQGVGVLESALELVEDQAIQDKLIARLHLLESTQASLYGLEKGEKGQQ